MHLLALVNIVCFTNSVTIAYFPYNLMSYTRMCAGDIGNSSPENVTWSANKADFFSLIISCSWYM